MQIFNKFEKINRIIMGYQIIDDYNNDKVVEGTLAKTFMSNVFSFMFLALAVSGITAYAFATIESLSSILYNIDEAGYMSMSIVGWIVAIAPIALVFLMGMRFQKMSFSGMLGVFILYSFLTGASLSIIFFMYTTGSIATTFLISAGTFGIMAIVGYTTSTDLTKLGSILKMAVIGLIIAMVVNIFLGSELIDYIISGIGVLVFTGLTAYDTQKLKNIGSSVDSNTDEGKKMAVYGALSLYLDFINLFLFLLRFLGSRD